MSAIPCKSLLAEKISLQARKNSLQSATGFPAEATKNSLLFASLGSPSERGVLAQAIDSKNEFF